MPRVARLKSITGEGLYHVISRTAIESYFSDFEKDQLVRIVKQVSKIYYTKVYAYSVMGNHFHLIVQMQPCEKYSETDFKKRYNRYKKSCLFTPAYSIHNPERIEQLKKKWSDLSEFVRDVKLQYTRWYNARNARRGFLWGGRFKSVLLEKGQALVNCMAYVDLNPVRAGITPVPEKYRWSSLYHHITRKNKDKWLCLDYENPYAEHNDGLKKIPKKLKLRYYRQFMYVVGKEGRQKILGGEVVTQNKIPQRKFDKAKKQNFDYVFQERFMSRCRYFSDSLIIGSNEFVSVIHSQYKDKLFEKRKRKFPKVKGYGKIYSMRDLRKDVAA